MGVYGVALAGWASNNKYALMGGLRSSAQMISYELPMALAHGRAAADLEYAQLARDRQRPGGLLLRIHPATGPSFRCRSRRSSASFIFLIAGFAETNRVPFDLPEAENELVAGFHIEYASMKFASFFMAEYANMVTVSCVATLLFLGGWHPLSRTIRFGFHSVADFRVAGADRASFTDRNPARPFDRITLPVFGVRVPGHRPAVF